MKRINNSPVRRDEQS